MPITQQEVNQVFVFVRWGSQLKGAWRLWVREDDELRRNDNEAFNRLLEEYRITISQKLQDLNSNKPYYLEFEEIQDPGGFYRKKHRKRFAHVFHLDDNIIIEHQTGTYGQSVLIMDILEKIRHVPTLKPGKQNLHKIIFGQILQEVCRCEGYSNAAAKQAGFQDVIEFITMVLQQSLYLTADANSDAFAGGKLTEIKHSLELVINNLEIDRLKYLIACGAGALKQQANTLIANVITVLNVVLEYNNIDAPVVGFGEISRGMIGTAYPKGLQRTSRLVGFTPGNPCMDIEMQISQLFVLANLDDFDSVVNAKCIPSVDFIASYITAYRDKTILAEIKLGGLLGSQFALSPQELAQQVNLLLDDLHFFAHGLRVFTYLSSVANHQVGDLLQNIKGLKQIEEIMDNYVMRLNGISQRITEFMRPLEDKFHSKGVVIPTKLTMLVRNLNKLKQSPYEARQEQNKLAEAFKFRSIIVRELAKDKEFLFASIESMNKTFFKADLIAQLEKLHSQQINSIKNELMAYSRDKKHGYKFALPNIDADLRFGFGVGKRDSALGAQVPELADKKDIGKLFKINTDLHLPNTYPTEIHSKRAEVIYKLLAVIVNPNVDLLDKVHAIMIIMRNEIDCDTTGSFSGAKIQQLIKEIKKLVELSDVSLRSPSSADGLSNAETATLALSVQAQTDEDDGKTVCSEVALGERRLSVGPDVDPLALTPRTTMLFSAVKQADNSTAVTKFVLAQKPSGINKTDEHGLTPYAYAAQKNDAGLMRLLIEHGAEVGSVGHYLRTCKSAAYRAL